MKNDEDLISVKYILMETFQLGLQDLAYYKIISKPSWFNVSFEKDEYNRFGVKISFNIGQCINEIKNFISGAISNEKLKIIKKYTDYNIIEISCSASYTFLCIGLDKHYWIPCYVLHKKDVSFSCPINGIPTYIENIENALKDSIYNNQNSNSNSGLSGVSPDESVFKLFVFNKNITKIFQKDSTVQLSSNAPRVNITLKNNKNTIILSL